MAQRPPVQAQGTADQAQADYSNVHSSSTYPPVATRPTAASYNNPDRTFDFTVTLNPMASEIVTTAVVVLTMVMVGLTLGFVLIKLSGESSAGRLIKIVGKEE